jgi:pyruvate kinase
MKKVRTICTLGPSSNTTEMIEKLIEAGMDVARLNFSHGTHEEHKKLYEMIRNVSAKLNTHIAIMADLQGPKIRISDFEDSTPVEVKEGETIKIISKNIKSKGKTFGTTYENLANDVKKGDMLLIDDGNLRFRVESVDGDSITLKVIVGGFIKPHKGINLPGVDVSAPALTEKDLNDLNFVITLPVDFIALSFVRRAEDVLTARRIIHKHNINIPVIAKIEREEGVENIEEILKITDGIMIARGDMGVKLSPEVVPSIQKKLIKLANNYGKTVIVATQMLESMTEKPIPTRAEASDVANAIIDGADCTMLSGETAAGKYPVESVKMMEKIGIEAEKFLIKKFDEEDSCRKIFNHPSFVTPDAVCSSAVNMAKMIGAKAIVAYTDSGKTALLISKHRPSVPILAVTCNERTCRRLAMYWGVEAIYINEEAETTDEMIKQASRAAYVAGYADIGDFIIITAGIPAGKPGATNLIKVHRVTMGEVKKEKPSIYEDNNVKISLYPDGCISCGYCVNVCPFQIFEFKDNKISINLKHGKNCTKDGKCMNNCPMGIIEVR